MERKRTTALLAVTATAVLTLAACGGGSGKKSSGSGSDDNGAVLPNSAYTRASYDQVKQGGTLVQAIDQLPYNFIFQQANDGLGATVTMEAPAVLGGVVFKPDGQWVPDPNTVKSVKLVTRTRRRSPSSSTRRPCGVTASRSPTSTW